MCVYPNQKLILFDRLKVKEFPLESMQPFHDYFYAQFWAFFAHLITHRKGLHSSGLGFRVGEKVKWVGTRTEDRCKRFISIFYFDSYRLFFSSFFKRNPETFSFQITAQQLNFLVLNLIKISTQPTLQVERKFSHDCKVFV